MLGLKSFFPSDELAILNKEGKCPDCKSDKFNPGPTGGFAFNVRCANCGSKFWYGPPFSPKRIDSDDRHFNLLVQEKLPLFEN